MTARMLHLTMWYAGYKPSAATNAMIERGVVGRDYSPPATIMEHWSAFYRARVEQHR